jgi:hypothetical protein
LELAYEQIVTVDFETYFAQDYSLRLKEYNTSGYVRDPQFKSQCVGIKVGDQDAVWIPTENVAAALHTIDWSVSALLAHHTAFDGFILSHHYGIFPAYCLDTLSMGRALHSNGLGAGLDELAAYYRIGNKTPNVLNRTKGIRDLPPGLLQDLGQYCAMDTELCYMLYEKMIEHFTPKELNLIDMTVRMFTEPVLQVDLPRVEKELVREIEHKAKLIADCGGGVTDKTLGSNIKFANLLRDAGCIPIPEKLSPTTGLTTYAFAKNDLNFQELRTHEKPQIRTLVEARMAVKSSIGETRARRFISEGRAGSLPVYLSYYGAHTGRWSGGNKVNMQNLKRGGELRRSILAPDGHVLVVVDSAQIEARVLAWFAKDQTLLNLFESGEDAYKHMAKFIYSKPLSEITKTERFVGKVAVLGLGYNMGWKKFQYTLATGAMGPPVILSEWDARNVVNTYRAARWRITELWKDLQHVLDLMVHRDTTVTVNDLLIADCETNKVYLPNGMYLEYPGLQQYQPEGDEWSIQTKYFDYKTLARAKMFGQQPPKNKGKNIYGGLFTENIVQALSRIIISDQMLAIETELKPHHSSAQVHKIVTMTHDEIVTCVPEEKANEIYTMMHAKMCISPDWCKDLPLDAEGGFAKEYSK